MTALSVVKARTGRRVSTLCSRPHSERVLRRSELAATPPDAVTSCGLWFAASSGRGESNWSTTAASKDAARSQTSADGSPSEAAASTTRFSVIDAQTASVSSYALSNEAYTEEELHDALHTAGFGEVQSYPSLTGSAVAGEEADLPVVVARR